VALPVSGEVASLDFLDRPFIDYPFRHQAIGNQFPRPGGGVAVVVVVIVHYATTFRFAFCRVAIPISALQHFREQLRAHRLPCRLATNRFAHTGQVSSRSRGTLAAYRCVAFRLIASRWRSL
jgi:hypothetical protein